MEITRESIKAAEQTLVLNGVDPAMAAKVLNAVGVELFGSSLYDQNGNTLEENYRCITCWADEDVIANAPEGSVSRELAEFWWKHNSRWFGERMCELGNETFTYSDWDELREEMEEANGKRV